jgi:ABC-type Fe3+/spermidine/putrescine transport system ATPase subunit
MHQGGFEQVAEKHEVYTNPGSAFVAGFVGHANSVRARLSSVDAGTGQIEWTGARILTKLFAGASEGQAVDYFVKCERMSLQAPGAPQPGEGHNRLEGRLRDMIFKGQVADYLVALGDGTEITVSDATQTARGPIRQGEQVSVVWPVEAGVCFPARES